MEDKGSKANPLPKKRTPPSLPLQLDMESLRVLKMEGLFNLESLAFASLQVLRFPGRAKVRGEV